MIKINPVWIIIGQFLAILVLTVFLVKSCNTKTNVVTPAPVIIEQITSNEDSSKVIIDSLKADSEAKGKALVESNKARKSAEKLVTELLNAPPLIINNKIDSTEYKAWLQKLKEVNAIKDSLANLALAAQQSIIENQQKQMSEKDELYRKNRAWTDSLATNQNNLEKVNLGLTKKLSSSKTVNKVLAGVVVTLATIVAIKN